MAATKFDWSKLDAHPVGKMEQPAQTTFDWSKLGLTPESKQQATIAPEEPDLNQGWRGVGRDVLQSALGLPESIIKGIPQIPGEIYGAGKQWLGGAKSLFNALNGQPTENPRMYENISRGIQNIPEGISNAREYLENKGLLKPNEGRITRTEIGNEEQQPGDAFWRAFPSLALTAPLGEIGPATGLLRGAQRGAAGFGQGVLGNENPIQAAILQSVLPAAPKTIAESVGLPGHLVKSPRKLGKQLNAAEQQEALLNEQLQQQQTKQSQFESVNEELKRLLGEGEPHAVKAAPLIVEPVKGVKNPETGKLEGGRRGELSNEYNAIRSSIGDQKISLPQTIDTKEIIDQVNKITSSATSPKIKEQLIRKMINEQKISSPKDIVSGTEFYDSYRQDLQDAREYKKNASKLGLGVEEAKLWKKRAQEAQERAAAKKTILDTQINPDIAERLNAVNKRYSTEYIPARKNPLFKELEKHGRTSKNMLEYLSGTTEGNSILNNLVSSNPELQRLILGQSFAEHPEALLKPNQLAQQMAAMHKKISTLMQEQQKAHVPTKEKQQLKADVKNAQTQVKELQKAYDSAVKRRKDAIRWLLGHAAVSAGGAGLNRYIQGQ